MTSKPESGGGMTDTAALLEVVLTDADGNEHIYWVTRMPEDDDDDAFEEAILKARRYHVSLGRPHVPDDDFDDEGELVAYAMAYEPFERESSEYTRIPDD